MKKIKKILVVVTIISMFSVLCVNFITLNEFEGRQAIYNTTDRNKDLEINPRASGIITIFEDDFESGLSKWNSITGLWHLVNTSSSWPPPWDPYHSPIHSMWYGDNTTGDYDTGVRNFGNLTSIPIDLSSVDNAYLEFYHWKEVETWMPWSFDVTEVYITMDNVTWEKIYDNDLPYIAPWEMVVLDISSYCGNSSVQIRFWFDTGDPGYNNFRGWLVDDVKIWGFINTNPPALTLGSVSPPSGDQSILFTYTVNYTDLDNSVPVYLNVSINGTEYSMSKQNPSDVNYTDGCIYEYFIYLQPGIYNYFFQCWDGLFYNSTSLTYNPSVSYTNSVSPTFPAGGVLPSTGWNGTTIFEFLVLYDDNDNNEPQYINVTINSTTYPMQKQDPLDFNYMDGCWYVYPTVLNEMGSYTCHFNCSDGIYAIMSPIVPFPTVYGIDLKNYSMIVGHPYNWINTTTGTELLLNDNEYSVQDLPFNFTYYNETFSTVYLGVNGYLSFTDLTPDDPSNDPIPSTDIDNRYLIAPFWDNLYTLFAGGNGTVYVQNFTDYWIASWFDIEHMDGNYVGTFEVILYKNGDIIFNYDLINYTDDGYTCGLNGLVLDAQTRYFSSYQEMNASDAPIDDFSILFTPSPPKSPYIIINSGDNHTDSTLVSLAVSAFGAEEMCFRNATSGTWTSWEPYTTIKQFYLEDSTINTTSGIYVKFRNLRGESAAAYDDIIYLIFHPGQLSIVINNGDASTNSTLVTLTLLAVGAEEMCFRNGTTGAWTAWETYSTTKQLYLAGSINNTVYTICAKFQNATGESFAICDNILYLEGITPATPFISGYSFEWLAISLVGVIGIILLFNKKRRLK